MDNPYQTPKSELEQSLQQRIRRPVAVSIIASIFFVTGLLLFISSLQNGLLIFSQHANFTAYRLELAWLFMLLVATGLLRGGRLARGVATMVGLLLFILPGLLMIYLFYISHRKAFFYKSCSRCGNSKFRNSGYNYRHIKCRSCGQIHPLYV